MTTAGNITTEFGFHVEYVGENDELLRDQRLTDGDFGHAVRHVLFDAFRQGQAEQYTPQTRDVKVEPVFPSDGGLSPRASGFEVAIPLAAGGEHRFQFDIKYFGQAANRLRAELLRNEALTTEQELYYRLNAYLNDEQPPPKTNKLNIALQATGGIDAHLGSRRDFGPAQAWDEPNYADLPVVIDQSLLEESVEEARADGEREIAGFLLGNIHRDVASQEVFLAVTGLASAAGTTQSNETSVTYTPASFAHARDMIKLRGAGEAIVGWYHSHPFKLCAECPLPTPPECIAKVLFYSQDDIHLMETTFEQPFMVGLLVAVDPRIEQAVGHLPVKLYGWRDGVIRERGFEVVQPALLNT